MKSRSYATLILGFVKTNWKIVCDKQLQKGTLFLFIEGLFLSFEKTKEGFCKLTRHNYVVNQDKICYFPDISSNVKREPWVSIYFGL